MSDIEQKVAQVVHVERVTIKTYILPDLIASLEKAFADGYTFSEQAGNTAFRIGMQTSVELIHKDKLNATLTKEAEEKLKEKQLKKQIADDATKALEDDKNGKVSSFESISDGQAEDDEEVWDIPVGSLDYPDETPDTSGTITDGRDKATLDDATKAIVDIDWDLLNEAVSHDDKDYLKEIGLKFGITIPKNKSSVNMLKMFREGIEVL